MKPAIFQVEIPYENYQKFIELAKAKGYSPYAGNNRKDIFPIKALRNQIMTDALDSWVENLLTKTID